MIKQLLEKDSEAGVAANRLQMNQEIYTVCEMEIGSR